MKLKRYRDWRLFYKMSSIFFLSIAIITTGILLYFIPALGNNLMDEKKQKTKHLIELAFTLINQYEKSAAKGELSIDEAKNMAMTRIRDLRYDGGNYIWINNMTPKMVMHPIKSEMNGQNLSDYKDPTGKYLFLEMVRVCKQDGEGFVNYMWPKPGSDVPVQKISYVKLIKSWGWIIGTGIYVDDVQSEMVALRLKMLTFLAICTGLIILISLYTTRIILKPILKAISFAEEISKGNLTNTLNMDQEDEIGNLVKALNMITSNLNKMIQSIKAGISTLNSSSMELESVSDQISVEAENASQRSNHLSGAAKEMSSNLSVIAAASDQATGSVNNVAGSMEEMSSIIKEIAQSSEKARFVIEEAVSQSNITTEKMSDLGNAADKISKVTEMIIDIAEQTNLLALNASIEAARAGEAGKGFAVVANEIKALASQTSDATQGIKIKTESMQDVTHDTINEISHVINTIKDISEAVSNIASSVEEQSNATEEISSNISQASLGIREINQNLTESSNVSKDISKEISVVDRSASQIAKGSIEVNSNTRDLNTLAQKLSALVDKFEVTGSGFDVDEAK